MAGLLTSLRRAVPRHQPRAISPIRDLEDLFERFWSDEGDGLGSFLLSPPMDMSETAEAINLRMDLPGVDPKEIDIQVSKNQLTVSGERKVEQEQSDQTFHRLERRVGRFSRAIMLPCDVQDNLVEAKYQDGVLRITLPKSPESTSRHIAVKT